VKLARNTWLAFHRHISPFPSTARRSSCAVAELSQSRVCDAAAAGEVEGGDRQLAEVETG
jgi:hypothetical protein